MTTVAPLNPNLSEKDFQVTVIDYCKRKGWLVTHARPTRVNTAGKFATALQGHSGCPDLILARDGVVMLIELKSRIGRLSPMQRRWIETAGPHARVYRPADWPTIVEELR